MIMRFSPSTLGFYLTDIHGANIPPDSVEITAERHAELLAGQAVGQQIAAGADGLPILVQPPPPTLDQVRAVAVSAMEAWIAAFLSQFTAGVPAAELASWPVKADRARAHLGGTPQSMILAEAAITGEDAGALAQKIVAKADAYEAIIARVTGLRRATEAAIGEAETPEAVAAVLAAVRAQAEAMAASLGVGSAPS